MGAGAYFSNSLSPQVVVRVGDAGSSGVTEISDMVFSTRGPAGGAIVLEWNVRDPAGKQGVAGMWDSIIRIGGADGTNLLAENCPTSSYSASCMGAFMGLRLTKQSTAYIEVGRAPCACSAAWLTFLVAGSLDLDGGSRYRGWPSDQRILWAWVVLGESGTRMAHRHGV